MIFHHETKIIVKEQVITHSNVHDFLKVVKTDEDWVLEIYSFLRQFIDDSGVMEIQSSGTTGQPKKMSVSKDKMVNSARATGNFFSLQPGDLALLPLPLTYIAGKMMLVRALALGLSLRIVKPSSNPLVENHFSEKFDFATFVPLQLANMLNNEHTYPELCKIRKIIIGGAGIDFHLLQNIRKMPNPVFETFGMTETLSHVAVRHLNNREGRDLPFEALPGVKFSKDDRNCLVIEAERVLDSPLVTNDVVELAGEHAFFWLGRIDNIINTGGIKISPEMIEKKLEPFLDREFCIVSLPDPLLGQKIVLVVGQPEPNNLQLDWLIKKMKDVLPRFGFPKEIHCLPEFFRNNHGKIIRNKLVEQILSNKTEALKIF